MAIQTSFTIKHVNVDQALKEAETKAKNTANKIDQTLNKSTSKGLKEAAKGLSAVGQNMGGLTKGFGLLTSQIALAGAAIGMLVKQLKGLWDDLTLSQQEKLLKSQFKLADSKEKRQQTTTQHKTDNEYLQQLKSIASQEQITNRQMMISMQIIQNLTKKYGDLGIQVDLATNKIKGLTEAQIQMDRLQRQQKLADLQDEFKDMKSISWQKMASVFVGMQSSLSKWLMQWIYENFGKVRPSVNEALNMMSKKTISQQIDFFTILRKRSTRKDQIKEIQQLINYLKQMRKIEQAIKKLKQSGASNDSEQIQKLKAQIKSEKDLIELNLQNKRIKEQKDKIQENFEYKNATSEQKQAMLDEKIKEYESLGATKKEALTEEQRKLQSAEASNNDQLIVVHKTNIARLQKEILEYEKQILILDLQKKEIEMQTNKFYQQKIDYYDNELQYQKLLLNGQYEQAERLRIINELKKQRLKIDDDRIDKILQSRRDLNYYTIDQQLKKQAKQIYDKVNPKKTKQQRVEQKIKQLEKANKQQLSDEQKGLVQNLVSAEINLEKLQGLKLEDFSRFDVRTNELSARGGFSGAVVLSNTEKINMEIKNKSEQQVNLLKQIKDLIADVGVIN